MEEQQCREKLEEVCGQVEVAECREEQVGFSVELKLGSKQKCFFFALGSF